MRKMRQLLLAAGLKAIVIVLPTGETPEESLQRHPVVGLQLLLCPYPCVCSEWVG